VSPAQPEVKIGGLALDQLDVPGSPTARRFGRRSFGSSKRHEAPGRPAPAGEAAQRPGLVSGNRVGRTAAARPDPGPVPKPSIALNRTNIKNVIRDLLAVRRRCWCRCSRPTMRATASTHRGGAEGSQSLMGALSLGGAKNRADSGRQDSARAGDRYVSSRLTRAIRAGRGPVLRHRGGTLVHYKLPIGTPSTRLGSALRVTRRRDVTARCRIRPDSISTPSRVTGGRPASATIRLALRVAL